MKFRLMVRQEDGQAGGIARPEKWMYTYLYRSKPIDWRGSSHDDLRDFPNDAKRDAGYQLRKIQEGEEPDHFKPIDREAPIRRSFERTERKMKTARKNIDLKSRHVTPADGNVFADLGFSPKEAKALLRDADARIANAKRLKTEAATAITEWIHSKKLTQVAASEILEVSRPRVSDLVNLKLGRFSLDTLVEMLFRTGKNVDLVVR